MKATWMAAGLVAVVAGLTATGAWDSGPAVWTVVGLAVVTSVAVDVLRARYATGDGPVKQDPGTCPSGPRDP